jgi:hypothetical protein
MHRASIARLDAMAQRLKHDFGVNRRAKQRQPLNDRGRQKMRFG